ncbi:MAG: ABC transporter substrate-binding protein, partial [Ruthenibacterium sp.]
MKKLLASLLTLVMALSLAACGAAPSAPAASTSAPATDSAASAAPADDGKVYELRCSTNLAATSTVGKALAYFAEQLNEKAGGRIAATANF